MSWATTKVCAREGCGRTFIAERYNHLRQKFCSAECARQQAYDIRVKHGRGVCGSLRRSRPGVTRLACLAPKHPGKELLPVTSFYRWEEGSGKSNEGGISGWCKGCLKRWLLEHDMEEGHGQRPEADDLARLDLMGYLDKPKGCAADAMVLVRKVAGGSL